MPHEQKTPEESPHAKRLPYTTPRLTVHGALESITRAVGSRSNLDGGMGTSMRSAP